MGETVNLKVLRCPSCGGSLKIPEEETGQSLECICCGNMIIPVEEKKSREGANEASQIRIEGIKTPASAAAYVDQFFDAYDWDSFALMPLYSVPEIDQLVENIKTISADDYATWVLALNSVYIPIKEKISAFDKVENQIAEANKRGDELEATALFDSYRATIAYLMCTDKEILAKIEHIIAHGVKYGFSEDQRIASEEKKEDCIRSLRSLRNYVKMTDIEKVQQAQQEKEQAMLASFAAKGIDAEANYQQALALCDQSRYQEALSLLYSICGYKDSQKGIDEIEKYYVFDQVLEILGTLYYYADKSSPVGSLSLYRTKGYAVEKIPFINDLTKVLWNYTNKLYYAAGTKIKVYDLFSGKEWVLKDVDGCDWDTRHFNKEHTQMFFLRKTSAKPINGRTFKTNELYRLDMSSGVCSCLQKDVIAILDMCEDNLIYEAIADRQKPNTKSKKHSQSEKYYTNLCLDTHTGIVIEISEDVLELGGVIDDHLIYAKETPTSDNFILCSRLLQSDAKECIIERNIRSIDKIIDTRIYYSVGNQRSIVMVSNNYSGTDREQILKQPAHIGFVQSGWIYLISRSGYNTAVHRMRPDGSNRTLVAQDVDRIVGVCNGNLYYVDEYKNLCATRLGGGRVKVLGNDIDRVIAIRDNRIFYLSYDQFEERGMVKSADGKSTAEKVIVLAIKSLYCINGNGDNKQKLAYDVLDCKEYDSESLDYVTELAQMDGKNTYVVTDEDIKPVLFRLNTETLEQQKLLVMPSRRKPQTKSGACYIATAVYGSYEAPQVVVLRRYRDEVLQNTIAGRLFIKAYYRLSPPVARWLRNAKRCNVLVRTILDKWVDALDKR